VADTVHEGHRLSLWTVILSTNLRFILRWQMKCITHLSTDEVTVFCKQSNPKKSYLIKPGNIGFGFTVGIAFAPIFNLLFGGSAFLFELLSILTLDKLYLSMTLPTKPTLVQLQRKFTLPRKVDNTRTKVF
jgi:hypothetical protein